VLKSIAETIITTMDSQYISISLYFITETVIKTNRYALKFRYFASRMT